MEGRKLDITSDVNPDYRELHWVSIEGGAFKMGSTTGNDDEQPVHKVTVPSFEILETEVTVSQYNDCVLDTSCMEPNADGGCSWGESGYEDHPVNCVDWNQAVVFFPWVQGRLPSEAEWEYAARSGGEKTFYAWGDELPTCDYAVMDDGVKGCGTGRTWDVSNGNRVFPHRVDA